MQTLIAELSWLADLLMPAYCQLCHTSLSDNRHTSSVGTDYPTLCARCAELCQQAPIDACPLCSEPYNSASIAKHLCSRCIKHPPHFVWLKTAGIYNDTLAKAIHQFKYTGKPALATGLAQCMLVQLSSNIANFSPDLIVPVPLHISRLRHRGFNQSLLLAQQIGKQLAIPLCATALQRTRPTSSQAQLNANQRRTNLRGAFAVRKPLQPQKILLVDDIVTTGTTVGSCAEVLHQHGHSVAVVALGRASLT